MSETLYVEIQKEYGDMPYCQALSIAVHEGRIEQETK